MPAKKAAHPDPPPAPPDPPALNDAPPEPRKRRPRAPKRRVAGDVVRAVRRSLGYTREELCDHLRVGSASLARYELADAPPWMSYALIGIGVLERGVPVDEMIRRVAAEEEAVAAGATRRRTTSPPRRTPAANADGGAAPASAVSKRTGRKVSGRASKKS